MSFVNVFNIVILLFFVMILTVVILKCFAE
jgi:hypothetical protein